MPEEKNVARPFEESGLKLDDRNANKGTKRGLDMLEVSVERYGAGRSVLATADGVVIAGNKTAETCALKGIPVREVETDGHELIVVKRKDLQSSDPRARELAVADNRVGEIDLDWDGETLAALKADGVQLERFFYEEELEAIGRGSSTSSPGNGEPPPDVAPHDLKCPKCGYEWSDDKGAKEGGDDGGFV